MLFSRNNTGENRKCATLLYCGIQTTHGFRAKCPKDTRFDGFQIIVTDVLLTVSILPLPCKSREPRKNPKAVKPRN